MNIRELKAELDKYPDDMKVCYSGQGAYLPIEDLCTRTAVPYYWWYNYSVDGTKILVAF